MVMGSGPSLRLADERVYKFVTIAVNGSYIKFPKSQYYLTGDVAMTDHRHWPVLRENKKTMAILPSKTFHRPWMRTHGFEDGRAALYDARPDPHDLTMGLKDRSFICGLSSANIAVNAAVILGCSPIYLIGLDCRCVEGKKYFWEFPSQPKDGLRGGGVSHWLKSMEARGKKIKKDWYDDWFKKDGSASGWTTRGWQEMARANPELVIVNVSGGPLADLFRTIAVGTLLNQ